MSYICEKIIYCLHMVKRCLCYIFGLLRRLIFGKRHRFHTPEHTDPVRYDHRYHRLESTDSDDDDDERLRYHRQHRLEKTDSYDDKKLRIREQLWKRKQGLLNRQGWSELFEKRNQYINEGKLQILKDSFRKFTKELLEIKMKSYLRFCLQVGPNTTSVTTKEQYRAYGLLLSACNLKNKTNSTVNDNMQMPIVRKVLSSVGSSYLDESHLYLEEHVIKAVRLSQDMLTLIPPMIVLEPRYYDESQHDTFRKTWDETKSDHPLYYYRPVLVYGVDQTVAVKGLVANCEVVT